MSSPAPASPVESSPHKGAPHEPQQIDWDFWGEVMSDYEGIAKTRPRDLSKAIQNGIPPALRGMMWQLMSASKDPHLEATYSQLLRLPSTHEKAILRDLNRTFPTHEYFHDKAGVGQNNLLNIMKAYSLYDDEVGYCQGMAFVVGPLLLNMPDEEAFCVLVRLMKSYDLRSQYIPDMPGLQLRLYQFDRLLEELLPAVFMHLLRQGIKSSMYASQWFLTLLAYRFPLELVCSVFDLIFAEGVEAIFRFALAVMKRNEDKIVTMEFEQVLEFLKTGLFEEYKVSLSQASGMGKHQMEEGSSSSEEPTYSVQMFVKEALQVKITPMMLDQYTSEWTEMCRQQNAQSAEVEQLRAINKKLSHQVRHLEASLSQINQEHCELVKQVVATRLEKEELEDELVRVKMALAQESLERRDSQLSIPK
ncbi:RabGAP/TBC [Cystobasidium minutum MCA 4210]|uniref:RabGAP/TBC n=1 Tax=Cystobasidium minutum MCA 4210 TaxID=1397322 RepID=UPI0034CF7B32|eukprot:jgi/Rhomi1/183630/fgenesh1_pm.4_\